MTIDDKRLPLLLLLVRLNILGMRKVSFGWHTIAGHGTQWTPPLCAIELAVVSLSREYIEFVVKKRHLGEDWLDLGTL